MIFKGTTYFYEKQKLHYRFFIICFNSYYYIIYSFLFYFYKHFDLKQNQSLDYYANFNDLKQHTTKIKIGK